MAALSVTQVGHRVRTNSGVGKYGKWDSCPLVPKVDTAKKRTVKQYF